MHARTDAETDICVQSLMFPVGEDRFSHYSNSKIDGVLICMMEERECCLDNDSEEKLEIMNGSNNWCVPLGS